MHYEKFADDTVKCIEGEIPFAMPEGWAWARLKNITLSIRDGSHNPPIDKGHGIPMLSAVNINNSIINIHGATRWVTEEEWEIENKRTNIALGDVLLTIVGTIGRSAVVETDEHFALQRSVSVLKPCMISSFYLMYILQTPYVFKWLNENSKGTAQKGIYLNTLSTLMIPIPPLNEEQEIVKILENSNESIIHIEKSKDYLFNLTSMARSKILDLAIRGKLVPQDEQDEPASVLLERIRAEKEELIRQGKIKRNKKESVIYRGADNSYYERFTDGSEKCIDEEISFEIPGSWLFVRLKEIGSIIGGGTPRTSNESYWDGNIYWITPADLSNHSDIYISHGSRSITELGLKDSSATLMPAHTVLYSSRAPIGHIAIAANALATNQGFKSVVPHDTRMSLFVYFCLKERTPSIVLRATGTTFKEISGTAMAETIVPLPPLREQKRICNKIRSLFTLLENMHQIID